MSEYPKIYSQFDGYVSIENPQPDTVLLDGHFTVADLIKIMDILREEENKDE